jgi:hypothetical protein
MAGAENQVIENKEVMLIGLRNMALAKKDVKNEDCSG